MSKKIMQINITCGVGSTGRISEALYYATSEKGYDVFFAYSAYKPTIKTAFRIENTLQNIFRRGLNKYIGRKQKHSSPGTKRLIHYIKKLKPDLIHLHNVQQNSVNYILLFDYLKKQNIPIVFTLHDCWSFTGGCYHFTKEGCGQYQTGCLECLKNSPFDDVTMTTKDVYEIKAKLIGQNINIYPVCVSQWLCNVAMESCMGKMKHVPQVICNGIDVDTFYPRGVNKIQKCNILENQFVILGVASYWNDDKGLSLFVQLAKKLDASIKIILIGSGLERIKNLKDNRFICVDRTESVNELAEYYSMADVFINMSIEETFGLTTAEALACGTPAIVFNSTACPEVIDEYTGICIPFDLEALVNAVLEIKEKGKQHYTVACRERAVSEFSKEKMINKYLDLYRSILHD